MVNTEAMALDLKLSRAWILKRYFMTPSTQGLVAECREEWTHLARVKDLRTHKNEKIVKNECITNLTSLM